MNNNLIKFAIFTSDKNIIYVDVKDIINYLLLVARQSEEAKLSEDISFVLREMAAYITQIIFEEKIKE